MTEQPIDILQPDPHNARRISPEALTGLGVSMATFGDIATIVWNARTGHLVAGHQRMEQLRAAGATTWQRNGEGGEIVHPKTGERFAVRIVDWDETTERAANLTANNPAIAGEYTAEALAQLKAIDDDVDYAGLRLDALQATLDAALPVTSAAGKTDPDEVPEAPKVPVTKLGDLWLLGEHRLLCGDSTKAEDVARLMGDAKADCVFTSPPYGVGVDYGADGYKDTVGNLRAMLPALAKLWTAVVVGGGFAVVNYGDLATGREAAGATEPCEYPMALEYFPVFRAAGWLLWSRRVWCKPNARVNSLWAISSNRAATDWEHMWTWKRPGRPAIVGRVNGEFQTANGWIDTSSGDGVDVGKDVHGAGMPTVAARRWIAMHSRHGALVHEPFCGTGTSVIACEQLGRRCRAIELSPAYVDVTVTRWENFTGRKATREPAVIDTRKRISVQKPRPPARTKLRRK
jgi:DNA modification methylase